MMAKNNPTLGKKIHEHLKTLGIETPMIALSPQNSMERELALNDACTGLVKALGLDTNDDSIQGTPARLRKMYQNEICYGLDYSKFPECSVFSNKMKCDELIAEKVSIKSLCEHHFQPFIGHAWIGYIPNSDKVIGLSKLNRVADFFSRRPQVQERLTSQINAALQMILETEDVAVVVEAEHFCVKVRGVQDELSRTITSKMGGKFFSVPTLRQEFLALTR